MSQSPGDIESQRGHKRFAMDCNNRAWELSVQVRTKSQDHEMLNAARASAWHWSHIGTELNQMRALMLLAEVHALLGMGASSLSMADEMRAYFAGRETPDWELAFVHTVYAHAAFTAGRLPEYREAYEKATAALGAIADEEDRKNVLETFSQVPPP